MVRRRDRGIGAARMLFPNRRNAALPRRTVLAVLICLSVALLTVSYRGGAVLHGAQLFVLDAVAPIERGLSRAWDPIEGAWRWTGRVFTAASEQPRLRRENAALLEQVRIAKAQEEELAELRRLVGFDKRGALPEDFRRVYASVSVRSPSVVERSMVIDRGSNDGIGVDDAVLVAGGLIGRVTAVTGNSSVVGLILDDSQQVSAKVTGSEARGVLRTVSTQGEPVLQMRFVEQSAKVREGDQVVTSGFRSGELRALYPGGLPIGFVSSVGNDPADVDKTVQVTPFADFDDISTVFVLVPRGGAR